jgi:hypothetical protein
VDADDLVWLLLMLGVDVVDDEVDEEVDRENKRSRALLISFRSAPGRLSRLRVALDDIGSVSSRGLSSSLSLLLTVLTVLLYSSLVEVQNEGEAAGSVISMSSVFVVARNISWRLR